MITLLDHFVEDLKQEILDEVSPPSAAYKAMVAAGEKKAALHRKIMELLTKISGHDMVKRDIMKMKLSLRKKKKLLKKHGMSIDRKGDQ